MQERRHSLIAIRSIQVPLILQSVLISFILINVVLIIAFLVGGGLSGPTGRLYLGMAVAGVEIICLVAVFMAARKQSNRIVGPLYRVEALARRLKEGDLTARAEVRSDDFFVDQLAALDEALGEVHDRVKDIQAELHSLEGSPGQEGVDRLRQKLEWFQTG